MYKDLPRDNPNITFFKEIESFKKNNPGLTAEEIVNHFDSQVTIQGISYSDWQALKTSEKLLIAINPPAAAITYATKEKAWKYTETNYGGHNGNGDQSDAFRHAVWSALMCKYISKNWSEAYGTAHEELDPKEYHLPGAHGFTKLQHRIMDLHNNKMGRDVWNIWTDSMLLVSDGELRWMVIK